MIEERVILFLKMASGSEFNDALVKRLKVEIRMQLSARHVPTVILEIADVPVSCFLFIHQMVALVWPPIVFHGNYDYISGVEQGRVQC